MEFRFSQHALDKLKQRGIERAQVESVLNDPQQVIEEDGKKIYQSKLERIPGKIHLLRVVVSHQIEPAIVITTYWTDQINKYWRIS